MIIRRYAGVIFSALGLALICSPAQAQFNIVIRAGGGLSSNQAALDSFNRAANQWAARITDPITVTIDADLASLGANILGSTNSVVLVDSYTAVRDALVADSAGEADDAIVAFLPTASNFRAALPSNVALSGNLSATKANFKAIGFAGLDTQFGTSDGTIQFSTNFAFDYDNRDGSTANTTDFETVAAHEIGHLLGFISAVDQVDAGRTRISPTTLDLYRFANNTANDPSSAAEFSTVERSLLAGTDAITDDIISEYRMSTGVQNGDGNQASHWKANELTGTTIGIMDPTLANIRVGGADFRAMDLIGYNVVVTPEPASLALALPVMFGFWAVRARRGVRHSGQK